MNRYAEFIRLVFVAVLTLATIQTVIASPASDLVVRLFETAKGAATAPRDERLLQKMREFVELDEMARVALGNMSATVTGPLRAKYLTSYNGLMIRLVQSQLGPIRPATLQIVGTRRIDDANELVATRVKLSDEREREMMWYVRTKPSPRVVDISYDGVMVTEMQRREFEHIVRVNSGDMSVLPGAIDRLNP